MDSLSSIEQIFVGLVLVLVLCVLYLLSNGKKKKKKLLEVEETIEGYKEAFEISEDYVLVWSKDKVIYANPAITNILDVKYLSDIDQLDGLPKVKIKKEWVPLDTFFDNVKVKSQSGMHSFPHTELLINENSTIPVNFHINKNRIDNGSWNQIVLIHDLRKEEAQKNLELRHKITNLPNQTQALNDLNALYAKTHLKDEKIAIILIEIDNFTKLRSLIGSEQANKIMVKISDYLVAASKRYAIKVYHAYPNTFLLTMTDIIDQQVVLNFVEEIQSELKRFYKMKDVHLHLTASVGVSIYPDSGSTRTLLDNAYKALAEAETHGHGKVNFYIPKEKRFAFDEVILYNEMPTALQNREFEVYYQPIVKSDTYEIVSAEALIRWIHPEYGMIPPDAFIPIMEKTGFIIELGKFILDEVLKQHKRWEIFKFKPVKVSINASMIEFETENFVEEVKKKLKYHNVDPELITYEVTEGTAMLSEKDTLNELKKLQNLGIGISLDDFGTGYTSFSYLKKFPANTLKIDKSLVDYILTREEDQRIVQAMIELAHNLKLKVVVEGIENKQMAELLHSYGCDLFQGYYFSKPLPVYEFQRLLRDASLKQ